MQRRTCGWVVLVLLAARLSADEAKELQKRLQKTFANHVFMIRNFYGGDHLVFDAQGNLLGSAEPECWCAAQIQVQKLEIRDGNLILRGSRVVGTQKTHFSKSVHQQTQMQLDIALDRARMSEDGINKVLERVFLTRNDDLNRLVPGGWVYPKKTVAATNGGSSKEGADLALKASKVGNGVTPPRVVYSPDAVYTEEARKKKRQGTVVLWAVIDDRGRVIQIRVEQCLGAGLDDAAVDAVSRWKFEPARKNGQPVVVQMNIELEFPFTN